MLNISQLAAATGAPAPRMLPFLASINALIVTQKLDTPQRLAAFLAQASHESAFFSTFEENLNYSTSGLAATWPGRFAVNPNIKPPAPNALACQFGRTATQPANQQAIAEQVYGARMGNGPVGSGDGYLFRGRGIFQLTGRSNYTAAGLALGIDLMNHPDLAAQTDGAVRTAGYYWGSINGNQYADASDIDGLSRRINGGDAGLLQRRALYQAALKALTT